MNRFIYLLFLLLTFASGVAVADECKLSSKICAERGGARKVGGIDITRECWRYELQYDCISKDYQDYCQGISKTPGCNQINSECQEALANGECGKYKNTYQCGNLLQKAEHTTFLDTEYTITRDELDNKACKSDELDANCREVANICVEGAGTRNINGKEIYKDCWKYEKKYQCFSGSLISDCEKFEKSCKLVSEKCISQNKSGECVHKEKQFECSQVAGHKPISLVCNGMEYCIGGDCEEIKYKPNNNLDKAISGLSLLNSLKNDFDRENCDIGKGSSCKIFKGEANYCGIHILSSLNCCKNKGWLKDIGLGSCDEEEKKLAKQKEARLCHYVGSYCANKVLGICLEKEQSYCCFQSKISRIIHEQGREQLGISWGDAESPNCRALTIEELQRMDFSKINLGELFGEINARASANASRVGAAKGITESKVKSEAVRKLREKETVTTSVTGKDYQEEASRRIKQHYGN